MSLFVGICYYVDVKIFAAIDTGRKIICERLNIIYANRQYQYIFPKKRDSNNVEHENDNVISRHFCTCTCEFFCVSLLGSIVMKVSKSLGTFGTRIITGIIIFIIGNKMYCNGITKHIHKFD